MKITQIKIFKYSLPLNKPLYVGGKKLPKRDGLLIQLKSDQDIEGWGEIAPLPHLSQESLDDAFTEIKSLKTFLLSESIPEQVENLSGKFEDWLGAFHLKSSVQFGIEMAVLNLIADLNQEPFFKAVADTSHNHIIINGLLQGSKAEVIHQATQLVEAGYKALKLKVDDNIDEAIAKVQAVNKIIEGRALLHLDANQSWDLNKAIKFSNEVGCAAVDYIEEPFSDTSQITDFYMKTTIPVALDESISHLKVKEISAIDGVNILVLKPTIIGGIENTWKFMKEAKRLAIKTIISSAFESSVGALTLANLAGCSSRDNWAGLDTLKWFKKDLLKEKLSFEKGRLDISSRLIHEADIDFDLLEEVKT